ncbi:hypothetical protein PHLCEN_2v8051 [Hermanssonia centrifuga]|uniref:Aminoglycoside phosphotransferase domain-containing protein n=1 Tax=Hermanssonia centrifuga TaxID=98765 RepID=A0A2R6NUT7_9APHY|nr:hypothetical protein PHLCEN_2v8051 [Hermanssonia centrifuga]
MSFARCIRVIPTHRIIAWNPNKDSPVGATCILQEHVDNVIEPWQMWSAWSGFGNLAFAPGLSAVANLADPAIYIVKPLQLRHLWASIEWRRMEPFIGSTSTLHRLWEELWSHHRSRSICGSDVDREILGLYDDNEHCDLASFTVVANIVRLVAEDALRMLAQFPQYAQPCLVNHDYAYRDIPLDPDALQVEALIDWDDVHVMPFVVGIDYPEDIQMFHMYSLASDSNYYREGAFPSFPPDEYGEIIGAVDAHGILTGVDEQGNLTGVDTRDQRITNTVLRETYIRALQKQDARASQSDMWEVAGCGGARENGYESRPTLLVRLERIMKILNAVSTVAD